MASEKDITSHGGERAAIIHRETIMLALLIAAAFAAFVLTRSVAASNRDTNIRDAAEWYSRGQRQLTAADVDSAIDSFRRATVKNRDEQRYTLALAEALTRKHDYAEAESALLTLREAAPEDTNINLQLARLAADREDVTAAVRFYRSALYAPWSSDQADGRRRVRLELVRFLLAHGQSDRALSELIALSPDLPDTTEAHVDLAGLFAQAGDTRHALDQFKQALRIDPTQGTALAGAGKAAFALGDYETARGYLQAAPAQSSEIARLREVTDLVISTDPLANRLAAAERRRRLIEAFAATEERLNACIQPADGAQPHNDDDGLLQEARSFTAQLKAKTLDSDAIDAGVDLLFRIERVVVERCPPQTPLDQALILIGRRHGAQDR